MFARYHYYLIFAEECNVTRAAERLFISHQNLSKYLSNLEEELGVTLFQRKPTVSLTYEGKLLYETMRKVEVLEKNLKGQYADLKEDKGGEIRLGTTEGRFRILMPDLMSEFKKEYPEVQLSIVSASSPDLQEMVLNNQLDLIIMGMPVKPSQFMHYQEVLREKLYLVVSDNMLKDCFGDRFPACKQELMKGADLRDFQAVPFALNMPSFNSHILIDRHLEKLGVSLHCVHTSSHPDLHHMMSVRDYAASFCLTMYMPALLKLNEENGNPLNVFPIKDFTQTNPVVAGYLQNRVLSRAAKALLRKIRYQCGQFKKYDLPEVKE